MSTIRTSAALLLALTACDAAPTPQNAPQNQDLSLRIEYHVTELASLGGTALNSGNSINDEGRIAGTASPTGDATVLAATWDRSGLTALGTLGGPNSAVIWPVKNLRGIVSGIAETADLDPNGE